MPRPRLPFILLAAATLLSVLPLLAAEKPASPEWVGYRNTARDGVYDGPFAVWSGPQPRELWSAQVGAGYSAIVERNGRAYTMGNQAGKDVIWTFDAKTGKPLGSYRYPCRADFGSYRGPRSTPAVDDEQLYVVSAEGHLICLNLKTGKKVWEAHARQFGCKRPGWAFACSPLLLGDAVIYDLGKIVALDRKTGRKLWETRDFRAGYSSPMPFEHQGRTLLAVFPRFGLVVIDPAARGRVLGTYRWKTAYGVNAAVPIPTDHGLFISSDYGVGCAMVKFTGSGLQEVWRNRAMQNHFNTCVVHDGYAYGFSGSANNSAGTALACVRLSDGKTLWSQKGLGAGSLMRTGDKLVALGDRGQLVVLPATPEGFKPLARARILKQRTWTMPTLHNGRLYCRDEAGHLRVFDVSR